MTNERIEEIVKKIKLVIFDEKSDLGPYDVIERVLKEELQWKCKARAAGTSGGIDPQDCDWPFCDCDPKANEVIAAIEESGYKIVKQETGS